MTGILAAFGRGNLKKDPMRESAALTTVYLLEQNQKFEQYMRQKVDELEPRVAAQQARLSSRAEAEERELWAALDSFEAPLESDPVEMAMVDGLNAVDQVQSAVDGELPAEDDDIDADLEATSEPDEIRDYLALMSGAVSEPTVPIDPAPEITPPVEDVSLESEDVEIDEPNPVTATDETVPVVEPENVSEPAAERHPLQDASTSLPEEAPEFPADDITGEDWAAQPYETFQVSLPEAEAVEELWPELVLADEVELLGQQPADDGLTGAENAPVSPPATKSSTRIADSDVTTGDAVEEDKIAARAAAETEQTWDTALPQGQKGEWA